MLTFNVYRTLSLEASNVQVSQALLEKRLLPLMALTTPPWATRWIHLQKVQPTLLATPFHTNPSIRSENPPPVSHGLHKRVQV